MRLSHKKTDGFARQLEMTLNLPEDFLGKIYFEDDWTFIVKLHSVMEAALPFLLARALGKNEHISNGKILDALSELDMSSKIKLLAALDLLPKFRGFLRRLSAMRNHYVHDIKKIKMSLRDYVKKISGEDRDAFFRDMAPYAAKKILRGDKKQSGVDVKQNPKAIIYITAMMCLAELTEPQMIQMAAPMDLRSLAKYVLSTRGYD